MSTITIPTPKRASADRARIPVPPSTNNLFRGNGKLRFRTSEYKAWAALAEPILATLRPPAAFPVAVVVRVFGKINVQRDLDNLLKPIGDALVASGALPADDVRRVAKWEVTYEAGAGEAYAVVELKARGEKL